MVIGLAVGLVLVVFLGVYSAWTAGRLDRLHARLDAAAAGLHEALKHRADVAARCLPAPGAPGTLELAWPATELDQERERSENSLSRAIRDAFEGGRLEPDQREALLDAATRAGFARQFHNDAVRDVLVLRRRWIVRLFHLAGHAKRPAYFEIDDAAPENSDVAHVTAPYD